MDRKFKVIYLLLNIKGTVCYSTLYRDLSEVQITIIIFSLKLRLFNKFILFHLDLSFSFG